MRIRLFILLCTLTLLLPSANADNSSNLIGEWRQIRCEVDGDAAPCMGSHKRVLIFETPTTGKGTVLDSKDSAPSSWDRFKFKDGKLCTEPYDNAMCYSLKEKGKHLYYCVLGLCEVLEKVTKD